MGGKMSRTKGHSFERFMAADLRSIFPEARRHLEYQDGEAYGVDIANTGNFLFQCKNKKTYASINTIKEIKTPDTGYWIPVLITKANNEKPMAVLPWEDLLKILQSTDYGRNGN